MRLPFRALTKRPSPAPPAVARQLVLVCSSAQSANHLQYADAAPFLRSIGALPTLRDGYWRLPNGGSVQFVSVHTFRHWLRTLRGAYVVPLYRTEDMGEYPLIDSVLQSWDAKGAITLVAELHQLPPLLSTTSPSMTAVSSS